MGHGCYDVAKGGTVKVSLAVGKSYNEHTEIFCRKSRINALTLRFRISPNGSVMQSGIDMHYSLAFWSNGQMRVFRLSRTSSIESPDPESILRFRKAFHWVCFTPSVKNSGVNATGSS